MYAKKTIQLTPWFLQWGWNHRRIERTGLAPGFLFMFSDSAAPPMSLLPELTTAITGKHLNNPQYALCCDPSLTFISSTITLPFLFVPDNPVIICQTLFADLHIQTKQHTKYITHKHNRGWRFRKRNVLEQWFLTLSAGNPCPQGTPVLHVLDFSLLQLTWFRIRMEFIRHESLHRQGLYFGRKVHTINI